MRSILMLVWFAPFVAITICQGALAQNLKPLSKFERLQMLSRGQLRGAVVSVMGPPTSRQTADSFEGLTWEGAVDMPPYSALLRDGLVVGRGIGRYRKIDQSSDS